TGPVGESVPFCHLRLDYFDHPAARLHLEADLPSWACHNLNCDTEGLGSPFEQVAPVALVCPGIGHTRRQLLRLDQCTLHPISILNVGGMNRDGQQVALCIDHHLSFASIDLFAAIKTTLAAGFSSLDRSAV